MISKRRYAELALFCLRGFMLAAVTAMFGIVWYLFYKNNLYLDPFYAKGDYLVIALFCGIFAVFSTLYGGFRFSGSTAAGMTYSFAVSSVLSLGIMYVITFLLVRHLPAVLPVLGLLVCIILFSYLWSKFSLFVYRRMVPPMNTVLIYCNDEAKRDGEEILDSMRSMFLFDRELNMDGGVDSVIDDLRANRPDAVFVCGIPSTERNDIVKHCISHAIEAYVRPNIGDFIINGAKQMQLCSLPVMLCQRSYPPAWYLVTKRVMDIILSLIALLVFSPFMIVTAIAIKLYDGGPILYKQVRLTKNRRQFYVYKFRSMRVDAEKDGVARLASQNDDRITPVGKIIRSLRIDEMPQLFCILAGSMSIVGPRPERPEIAEQYEKEIPEFALRLQAKAGLTGYAQVYGKYNTTPYNKLQMDLQYIGSMGIVTDLKIIFATVKILFEPESTEGVSEGQTTASTAKEASEDEYAGV